MKKSLLLIAAFILLQACLPNKQPQIVTVEDKYELTLPGSLAKTNDLNEDASLQYQNLFKEFYVIAIDEPKADMHDALVEYELLDVYSDDIEGYSELIFDSLRESLLNYEQSEVIETTVNGLPAKLTSISGTIEGIDAFYTVGIYEGAERYYQVLVWTSQSYKERYETKMFDVLYSMNEVVGE